ncbi:MAG: hypothetical protein LQ340_000499 [Diploschistes diacapsis]|nr:MAG: hypothetical protein LQ340_000499 [Diploschistes diacapsis]
MSLQSNANAIIEDQPMADVTMDHGDSILSAATDMSMLSTASKARKPGRPKRGQAKSKTKTTRTKAAEAQASSIVEPEDDNFEIKVPSPSPKSTRGKKRKSEEMQTDTVEHSAAPPPKRATRVRSNTAKPEPTPVQPQEINVTMENADEVVPKPQPKKGAKGTRKRASSTAKKGPARKASTRLASTASKASLRAPTPADEEIEAQLEADLERFSSDGSDNWQVLGKDESEITGLHMPRVRASPGMVASPINTREGIESSALMSQSAAEIVGESELMIFERTEPILSPPITKKATRAGVKKSKEASPVVASGEQETAEADAVDDADVDMGALEAPVDVSIIQTTQEANHEAQSLRTVVQPQGLAAVAQEHINTSQITMTTTADDSGDETDSSILARKKVKRTSKKGSTKKGKQPKKTALITKKVEITVEVPLTRNNAAQQDEAEEQSIPEEAPDVVVKTKNEKASKRRLSDSHFEPKSVQDEADLKSVKESPALFQERQETIQSVEKAEPENLVEVRIEQPQAPAPIPALSPRRQAPSPTPTPQSSDAENHPPSARPSQIRPPLARYSPTNNRTMRIPLAASTPTGSPSRLTNTKLQTTYPWSSVDLDYMLVGTPNANKENVDTMGIQTGLTSPEKRMSLEEWIKYNAKQGEEKLKTDCEKIVGKFENEGVRALKALEGIVCSD